MKKVLAILLCVVMLLSSVSVLAQEKVYTVTLDLNNKSPFGAFDGWGTSICWWGHHLGENLTEEQLDSVVKALYDEEEGLGLNIARYNIGGGDDPEHNHQREFDGRDMPGVTDEDGNWNLNNDAGQIKALQLAVKYGADILEAFSNSPPYYMTASGCSSGNHNAGENNLPDDKFDDFAEYLAEAVLRIQNTYGIKFDTLEPFNESDTNYWGYEGWQEGCHFDVEDHSRLILLVREALNKRGLTDVGVSAADETNVWRTGENIKNVYTKEAINALGQVNTHSYSVGDYNHTRNAVLEANKPLYMTEVDGDGSIGGENSGNMGSALWFANKINEDLRGLEPNAWVMWQAVAMAYDGEHKDSGYWNIMSIDKETSELHKTKKYYAYKQFTKFIRPGDTLVKTDYSNIVSAVNEEEGKVVFVITNTDSASKKYALDMANLGMKVESAESYVTTQSYDCAKLELGKLDGSNYDVEVPPYSVLTVVMNGNVGKKSIRLAEKNNTKTAFVGDVLEFEVTDEKGNKVDAELYYETALEGEMSETEPWEGAVYTQINEEGLVSNRYKMETNALTLTGYSTNVRVIAVYGDLKDEYIFTKINSDTNKPWLNTTFRIVGSGSERALKVQGSDVVISDRDNTPSQLWTIEKHKNEYYAFKNEKTGKYLSTENFLTTSTLDNKALWKLEKDKGLYRIINMVNEESIDVYNHATHDGAQVGVYGGYYATPNQLFYFELATPETAVEAEYMAGEIELTGTPFGTEPWDGDANVTFDKAWDGDKETFFHAGRNDDRTGFTAIDLGEKHLPFNKVTLNSRPGFEYRGWEAVLSGSNEKDGEYTVIYKFSEEDFTRGEFASVELGKEVDYRYIKYETPNGGYTNIGEVNLIYAVYEPDCQIIGENVSVTTGRGFVPGNEDYNVTKGETVIVSHYEGDRLIKVEAKALMDCTGGNVCALEEIKDYVRIQLVGRENNLLTSFFIKKY